jgi:hypothetical protein
VTRHLLHIGYPKAGSTYLQRWFSAHPQLFYRDGGIGGFQNVYEIARDAATIHEPPLWFVTSFESLSQPSADAGDMLVDLQRRSETDTPAAQLRACRTLVTLFPRATVLIVTRGFQSMILSTYSQFVRSGGHLDFADLVAVAQSGRFDLIAPWDYDRLIRTYVEAFGAENVLVMPYELLRDDAAAFTRILAARLGIEQMASSHERVNESLSPVEMAWYPRIARVLRRVPSRRFFRLYVAAAFRNRLRIAIVFLQRLRPRNAVTAAALPSEVLESFRGKAESLRGNPLYSAYAADYLHGDA